MTGPVYIFNHRAVIKLVCLRMAPDPGGRANSVRHSRMNSGESAESSFYADPHAAIALRSVVAAYKLDDGRPYFTIELAHHDETSNHASTMSLQLNDPRESEIWLASIRAAIIKSRLVDPAPFAQKFIEHAAASLWSTPTDLLKAISAVQESLYTDNGFLSQATAKKMLSQVAPIPQLKVGMGLGWSVAQSIFAHSGGNDPGYRCYAFGFQDEETKRRDGFAVMTNGQLGHTVCNRIISAVFYLKGWKRAKQMPLLYSSDDEFTPLAAPEGTKIYEGWKQWIGKWGDDWKIVDDSGPAVKFRSFEPTRLKVAAAPPTQLEQGMTEFILAAESLDFGLRLTWDDGERIVNMLGEGSKNVKLRWSGELSA